MNKKLTASLIENPLIKNAVLLNVHIFIEMGNGTRGQTQNISYCVQKNFCGRNIFVLNHEN